MFIIYKAQQISLPGCSGSLDITIRQKNKYRYCAINIFLSCISLKCDVRNSWVFFRDMIHVTKHNCDLNIFQTMMWMRF